MNIRNEYPKKIVNSIEKILHFNKQPKGEGSPSGVASAVNINS